MTEPQEKTMNRERFDRRQLLGLGVGAFVVASLPLAISRRRGAEVVRRQVPVMGTFADLTVVGPSRRQGHAALDEAVAALRFVDRKMSAFQATSDVGRANAQAATDAVEVGRETAAVVGEALRWAAGTEGRFDPCLGRASALWDVKTRKAPPASCSVHPLAGRALWRHLDLDRERIRYGNADVRLDLGGIAKGRGVGLAARALRRAGIEHALVNVGGDLAAIGSSPDGDAWRVGIRSPEDPAVMLTTLRVADASIATSGDYEQAFHHEGRRYHHLLDAETAAPRESALRTLTVQAETCMAADAAATAFFGQEPAAARPALARLDPTARIVHHA